MAVKISYSRIGTFTSCPYQYKLRYVDKLKTRFNLDPANPLVVGTAIHEGIECNIEQAMKHYYDNYPSLTRAHILQMIMLEKIVPKAKAILPIEGIYEEKIDYLDFIGFIDMLVEVEPNVYDLYDFKYSNNVKNYLKSGQLHVYKYFFEKQNPTKHIRKLTFVFIPKINRGPYESLEKFEEKVMSKIDEQEVQLVEINYDKAKVKEFLESAERCANCKKFDKNITRLCDWCDYKNYCQSNGVDDNNIIYPDNYVKNESEE